MSKKIFKPFVLAMLIAYASQAGAFANDFPDLKTPDFLSGITYGENFSFFQANTLSTKRGEQYDEAKDPALRKGTENWEEPQGSYFAIPALVIGVMAAILFFNRDK